MNNKVKVYCAGGWFSPNQDEVLTELERVLIDHPLIDPYLPRHDGVKLSPGELHDPALREKVFLDNVEHIKSADILIAACDGRDGVYDTGTQWEIGYAMAHNIPVIAYDTTKHIYDRMKSIVSGLHAICHDIPSLLREMDLLHNSQSDWVQNKIPMKLLFVGPDSTESQCEVNQDLVSSVLLECHGSNFRWIDNLNIESLYGHLEDIFAGVDYMVAVIDDRHPIVSWLIGQAYQRNIPIITYTNYDYGVNIMLLNSLLYHCKGKDELRKVLQKVKREGIYSLPKFDDSTMKAY